MDRQKRARCHRRSRLPMTVRVTHCSDNERVAGQGRPYAGLGEGGQGHAGYRAAMPRTAGRTLTRRATRSSTTWRSRQAAHRLDGQLHVTDRLVQSSTEAYARLIAQHGPYPPLVRISDRTVPRCRTPSPCRTFCPVESTCRHAPDPLSSARPSCSTTTVTPPVEIAIVYTATIRHTLSTCPSA